LSSEIIVATVNCATGNALPDAAVVTWIPRSKSPSLTNTFTEPALWAMSFNFGAPFKNASSNAGERQPLMTTTAWLKAWEKPEESGKIGPIKFATADNRCSCSGLNICLATASGSTSATVGLLGIVVNPTIGTVPK
jgi:hypothetical protein